jgi:hypothetical protein
MLSTRNITGLFVVAVTGAALAALGAASSSPLASIPFDEARIFVEHNATDDDAEVVIDIDAEVGLERLTLVAPDGAEVLNLRAEHLGLGLRKFALETPEPSLHAVLSAYPPGEYRFYGRSVDGQFLFSTASLSHALPEAPDLIYPLAGSTDVPTSGASAIWTAGSDAASFFLEIESDDLGLDVKSNVAGDAGSFGFPEGWLAGGTEYQLGLGSRADNGNLTVIEIDFTTAP